MSRFFQIYKPYLIGLSLIGALIGFQIIFAPKNSKAANAECFVANDFHMVRFTFYRVQRDAGKPMSEEIKTFPKISQHCDKAPDNGAHFLTIDLMQREQRGVPIGISLALEVGEGKYNSIKNLEPQRYKAGVLEIGNQKLSPGNYRVQLIFDGGVLKEDTLNIPFEVIAKKEFDALHG